MTITHHLLDNASFASAGSSGSLSGGGFNFGFVFASTSNGFVVGLRWRRSFSNQDPPSTIALWDTTTSSRVAYVTTGIADGTGNGWYVTGLASAVGLVTGREYRVTGYWGTGKNAPTVPYADLGAAPSPLLFGDNKRCYHAGGDGYPEVTDTGVGVMIDVVWNDDGSLLPDNTSGTPVGGTGGAATAGDLASWLDTVVGDQAHSAPLLLKQEADGANGFAAIKAVADAVASAVSGLPGTIAGAVTTITGQITSSTADIFSHAVTGLTAISHDLAGVENHALDVLAGMVTFPGASPHYAWTAGDPIGFDQCVAVAVAADAYLLEVLDHPRHPLNLVCGVHVVYRAGWWCELSGGVGSERHFIDFEQTLLRAGNRRLSGCLVSLEPGCTGVLTPYTLDPA